MKREDIIRIAEECGIPEFENNESQADNIMRFAALVAAAEREACAKVCEFESGDGPDNGCCPTYWNEAQEACAAAIRARGQDTKTCPPCHGDCNQGRACPARGGHA